MNTYYCVVSYYYCDSLVFARIANEVCAGQRPSGNHFSEDDGLIDIYIDWFNSKRDAMRFIIDAEECKVEVDSL